MTSVAQVSDIERNDVKTIVFGGFKLGIVTSVGVVVFALLSRSMAGLAETVMQSVLILAGGIVVSFVPALWVRTRTMDGVGWAAMLGLMGALFFTVVDTAILRPIDLYHWTWDEIGGGSGFWYIPVWWMGSAFLATLGALIVRSANDGEENAPVAPLLVRPLILGTVLFAALTIGGIFPATSAVVALAFAGGMFLDSLIVVARN